MSTFLSPAQAAQAAKVSRRTITRAISAQVLRATRDNKNQWRIRPEDLDAWRGAQAAQVVPTAHAHPAQWAPSGQTLEGAHPDLSLQREVEGLRIEVGVLRETIEREREERLREQETAQEVAQDLRKSRDEAQAWPVPWQSGWPQTMISASASRRRRRGSPR
jgi:excisionase family DNA binding protein